MYFGFCIEKFNFWNGFLKLVDFCYVQSFLLLFIEDVFSYNKMFWRWRSQIWLVSMFYISKSCFWFNFSYVISFKFGCITCIHVDCYGFWSIFNSNYFLFMFIQPDSNSIFLKCCCSNFGVLRVYMLIAMRYDIFSIVITFFFKCSSNQLYGLLHNDYIQWVVFW